MDKEGAAQLLQGLYQMLSSRLP